MAADVNWTATDGLQEWDMSDTEQIGTLQSQKQSVQQMISNL